MFRLADFQRVVRDSHLTKLEIATIYGIARVTVYQWLEGQLPRDGSINDRSAFTITQMLLHALADKLLPLKPSDPKVRKKIVSGIRERAQNLKLAPAPAK